MAEGFDIIPLSMAEALAHTPMSRMDLAIARADTIFGGRSGGALTWLEFVKRYQRYHPKLTYKEAMVAAAPEWKKLNPKVKQPGQAARAPKKAPKKVPKKAPEKESFQKYVKERYRRSDNFPLLSQLHEHIAKEQLPPDIRRALDMVKSQHPGEDIESVRRRKEAQLQFLGLSKPTSHKARPSNKAPREKIEKYNLERE